MMVLPAPVGADAEGVAVLVERAQAALDEQLLAGTEQHARAALTAPRSAGRPGSAAPAIGGWGRTPAAPPALRRHRAHYVA